MKHCEPCLSFTSNPHEARWAMLIFHLKPTRSTVSHAYLSPQTHTKHGEPCLSFTSNPHEARWAMLIFHLKPTQLLFVGCLTSQQHVSVSQGRILLDNFMCCHIETEVADQTFHLTESQYTDTGPTSPSTDPITPGAWQGSHWSYSEYQFLSHKYDWTLKKSQRKRDLNLGSSALEADALTTRPTRRSSPHSLSYGVV